MWSPTATIDCSVREKSQGRCGKEARGVGGVLRGAPLFVLESGRIWISPLVTLRYVPTFPIKSRIQGKLQAPDAEIGG